MTFDLEKCEAILSKYETMTDEELQTLTKESRENLISELFSELEKGMEYWEKQVKESLEMARLRKNGDSEIRWHKKNH